VNDGYTCLECSERDGAKRPGTIYILLKAVTERLHLKVCLVKARTSIKRVLCVRYVDGHVLFMKSARTL